MAGSVTFGAALTEALALSGLTQADLAAELGLTAQAVSGWVTGRTEPWPAHVFAAERALGVAPGALSGHLGYVPGASAPAVSSVLDAVAADPALSASDRAAMRAVYRALTGTS
jgi:transcriptional regulator with XRE-family HTH domain